MNLRWTNAIVRVLSAPLIASSDRVHVGDPASAQNDPDSSEAKSILIELSWQQLSGPVLVPFFSRRRLRVIRAERSHDRLSEFRVFSHPLSRGSLAFVILHDHDRQHARPIKPRRRGAYEMIKGGQVLHRGVTAIEVGERLILAATYNHVGTKPTPLWDWFARRLNY